MEKSENKKIICKNKDGKEFEITADQLNFRPAAYGVIIKDGKILLSRQWDGYDFPGGGVNLGERIEDAVVREIKEETGFDVAPRKVITCLDDFHKMTFNDGFVHSILIYYDCQITGGALSKDNFDTVQFEDKYMEIAEWVDLDDIGKVKFYNPIRDAKAQLLDKMSKRGENQ